MLYTNSLVCAAVLLISLVANGSEDDYIPVITEPDHTTRELASELASQATLRSKSIVLSDDILPSKLVVADEKKIKDAAKIAKERGVIELKKIVKEKARNLTGGENSERIVKNDIQGLVILAISSSMPEVMISNYMAQLHGRKDALIVMRGFIGGAKQVKPTGKFLERIARKSARNPHEGHLIVNTVIDPLLFRNLGIERVPAVAYLNGVTEITHCDNEDYNAAVVVYGATRISAALKIAQDNGAKIPNDIISSYQPKRWETR